MSLEDLRRRGLLRPASELPPPGPRRSRPATDLDGPGPDEDVEVALEGFVPHDPTAGKPCGFCDGEPIPAEPQPGELPPVFATCPRCGQRGHDRG